MGATFSKTTKGFFQKTKKSSLKKSSISSLKDKPLLQRANESFLSTDLYAEPIGFNFKGLKNFTSLAGAILSFVVRLSVLIFAGTRTLSLI